MSEKLQPCPFCGNRNPRIQADEVDDAMMVVSCSGARCGITVGFFMDEGKAAAAWNKRHDIRRETVEKCEQVISAAIAGLPGPYGKDIEDVIAGVLESCKAKIRALKEA